MKNEEFYRTDEKLVAEHYAEDYEHYYNAIVPPVFMNSLNVFPSIDAYYNYDKEDRHSYCYGRVTNPTVRILEEKIAALDGACKSFAFASGMAAAVTAVLSVCKVGGHVVCIHNAYGPLKNFLTRYCKEHMNVSTTFISGKSVEEFEAVITERTQLVILESPSSVVFSVQDIEKVSELAHRFGAYVYIDNTYCTPLYQKPLKLGADLVMYTASKYLGGHSDIIGGVLSVKEKELAEEISVNREQIGGIIGPMEGWLVLRGLRTMHVRLKEHEETARKVAEFLEAHDRIKKVYYPGLASHPQHELIKKQQLGSNGLLSFEIDGTVEQAKKFCEDLKIFKIGVSWGGFESLVMMPFATQDEETCRVMGGTPNIIRIHCGLEGAENLIEDLKCALDKLE